MSNQAYIWVEMSWLDALYGMVLFKAHCEGSKPAWLLTILNVNLISCDSVEGAVARICIDSILKKDHDGQGMQTNDKARRS